MIHEVSGDILLSKAQVIAHGVAPNDDFHSGLALALREQWPAMYKDFRHFSHTHGPKAGGLWDWATAGTRLIALFTQDPAPNNHAHPGKASAHNVNQALRALASLAQQEGVQSLALPRLATGVGGLDWAEVAPLVRSHLGGLGIPVYVYTTYQKGVAADESGA